MIEADMQDHGNDAVLQIDPEIELTLVAIKDQFVDTEPYCEVCGRGDRSPKRRVPQGRFNVEAPRSYQLIRDDARKR